MAQPMSELSSEIFDEVPVSSTLPIDRQAVMGGDPVRQALTCLRSSDRRLRNPSEERTDEVLTLLRAATAHLQRAATHPDR